MLLSENRERILFCGMSYCKCCFYPTLDGLPRAFRRAPPLRVLLPQPSFVATKRRLVPFLHHDRLLGISAHNLPGHLLAARHTPCQEHLILIAPVRECAHPHICIHLSHISLAVIVAFERSPTVLIPCKSALIPQLGEFRGTIILCTLLSIEGKSFQFFYLSRS